METILIEGPIVLKLQGECNILGVKFKNQHITLKSNKIIPIEKNKNAVIKVLGNNKPIRFNDLVMQSPKRIGIWIWADLIKNILKQRKKRIIIIGSTDSGKSTLALYLANRFINIGLRPLLVDADIGQGDLAPPTCIGATIMNTQNIELDTLKTDCMTFVGNTQPTGYENRIILNIVKTLNILKKKYNVSIINTDGYIKGNGMLYKINLLKKIQPDCIIFLRDKLMDQRLSNHLYNYIPDSLKSYFFYGNTPYPRMIRSQNDRYKKRLKTYLKYLSDCNKSDKNINLDKIRFIYYKNRFFSRSDILNTKEYTPYNLNCTSILDEEFLKNRFVGLGKNEEGECISGFGLIREFNGEKLILQTTVKEFDNLYLSDIKLKFL